MATPKVVSGQRAKVGVLDRNTGKVVIVGIFNNFSYGVTYDVQPAYILGRETAASLDYTSVEPVQCNASGWRVVDHGPHVAAYVPRVQDLLYHDYIEITVIDRATGKRIATIKDVRPTGYGTTVASRQLEEITATYVGILVDDESTQNSPDGTAADLP